MSAPNAADAAAPTAALAPADMHAASSLSTALSAEHAPVDSAIAVAAAAAAALAAPVQSANTRIRKNPALPFLFALSFASSLRGVVDALRGPKDLVPVDLAVGSVRKSGALLPGRSMTVSAWAPSVERGLEKMQSPWRDVWSAAGVDLSPLFQVRSFPALGSAALWPRCACLT